MMEAATDDVSAAAAHPEPAQEEEPENLERGAEAESGVDYVLNSEPGPSGLGMGSRTFAAQTCQTDVFGTATCNVDQACQTDVLDALTCKHKSCKNRCVANPAEACDSSESDDGECSGPDYCPSSPGSDTDESIDINFVSLQRTRMLVQKDPKRYIGVPNDALFIVECLAKERIMPVCGGTRLDAYDICLLVLMKIKQGRQFAFLADDFGISRSYAGRIFAKYVDLIAHALSDLIIWPESDVVKKHLPLAFKARFSDVTCIIDCLEIEIEKPSAALKQSMTWSSYKSCNTIKYLLSITPNGLINFVSDGFGGRASDMVVLKRSGFLSRLEPGMVIMADRGFKAVEPVLASEGCRLVRPETVMSSSVLTRDQVLWSKQVASLRIHVERAIRRVREFAMLRPRAVIGAQLVRFSDYCIRIAAGLVNVQPPLTRV